MWLFSKKDHMTDWNILSEDEQVSKVKPVFSGFISGYLRILYIKQSPKDVDNLIENMNIAAENEGWFPMFAEQTSAFYKETNSNSASRKVIQNIIKGHVNNYIGAV